MILLAQVETAVETGILPHYFGPMLLAVTIVFAVSMFLFLFGWRIIDWITPGKLNEELVPADQNKKPNVALAIVIAAMLVSVAYVLGSTIQGVLQH